MKLTFEHIGLAVLVVGVVGCGNGAPKQPKVTRVEGVVTYQGAPVEAAVVTFKGQKNVRGASAITDAEGRFRMTTFRAGDGVLPGTYTVAVAKYPMFATSYDASGDIDSPSYTGEDNGVAKPEPRQKKKPVKRTVGKPVVTSTSVLPARYEQAATSGLQVVVEDGKKIKDLAFDLSD